ncbi:hypothetical protein BC835DRAFT_657311 [Cytidiella melzeri]|nr:hypothetical protein BC835DRAFT_657311 [Cytidiella melzeri]
MPVYNPPSQNRMVSRSNSFIGTIKSILPTKLPWFGSSSDQADTPTKRKQAEEKQDVEEGTRSNKRQRMDEGTVEGRRASGGQSAVPPSASGYLDPPQRVFRETTTVTVPRASPMYTRASSAAAPSRSRSRFSMSPGLGGARGQSMRITRTQSMDPPTRYRSASYKPVLSPMPMTRDVSMEDVSFLDTPTSPSRPFRMRTSLTPQIPDLDLSARRERDMSEPPPLSDLMDKPVFVRAPPEATRQATPMAKPLQRPAYRSTTSSGEGPSRA